MIYFGKTWENADGGWGTVVLDTALHKVQHTIVEAFVLGVLRNLDRSAYTDLT